MIKFCLKKLLTYALNFQKTLYLDSNDSFSVIAVKTTDGFERQMPIDMVGVHARMFLLHLAHLVGWTHDNNKQKRQCVSTKATTNTTITATTKENKSHPSLGYRQQVQKALNGTNKKWNSHQHYYNFISHWRPQQIPL